MYLYIIYTIVFLYIYIYSIKCLLGINIQIYFLEYQFGFASFLLMFAHSEILLNEFPSHHHTLSIEPRALYLLGSYSATELHSCSLVHLEQLFFRQFLQKLEDLSSIPSTHKKPDMVNLVVGKFFRAC